MDRKSTCYIRECKIEFCLHYIVFIKIFDEKNVTLLDNKTKHTKLLSKNRFLGRFQYVFIHLRMI